MDSRSRRSRQLIPVVLVLAVLVLGYLAVTDRSSLSSSSTSTSTVAGFYEVTFQQPGECSPLVYAAPWSVTIDQETIVEPPTATLPLSNTTMTSSPANSIYSTITFSLPDGVYAFRVAPATFLGPSSGTVTVDGSNVSVEVNDALSCAVPLGQG